MLISNQTPRDTILSRFRSNPIRYTIILISLCYIAAIGLFSSLVLSAKIGGAIKEWQQDHGYQQFQSSLSSEFLQALRNLINAWSANQNIPKLTFDVKFKHMQKLEQKRAAALQQGLLTQEEDDLVPGNIRMGNRSIPVKLRLKGDLTDHLENGRWAFRVHVKGNDHVLGMRRFSIHHPQGRDYHLEPLYFDLLRHEGVLAPRYDFVDVILNGESLGLMAMEEHFSKELLEHQERKESVILKFDESLVWAAKDGTDIYGKPIGFWGIFDNYANTTIVPFRESKVSKSVSLTKDRRMATGLLRAFVTGNLPASKVFDAEILGRFIAIAEAWGSFHSLNWNNQRHYYNPLTAKLEPIGYDGWTGHPLNAEMLVERRDPIVRSWLNDPDVWHSYVQTLKKLSQEFHGSALEHVLRQNQMSYLSILHRSYPFVGSFDFQTLSARAGQLLEAIQVNQGQPLPKYPKFLHAYVIQDHHESYIELANAIPHIIKISSLEWVDSKENKMIPLEITDNISFPILIPATGKRAIPLFRRVNFNPHTQNKETGQKIQVSFTVNANPRMYTDTAIPYYPTQEKSLIPEDTIPHLLSKHSFLHWDVQTQNLTIKRGEWDIHQTIALPQNISLTIESGTLLRFSRTAALIIRGPTFLKGTLNAPIILTNQVKKGGIDKTWKGIAVLRAQAPSHWSYVTVSNTAGIAYNDWELTGGVTFYQSEANLDHCKFSGNKSEDAINIVRTTFNLSNIEIVDALSDALDSDFSQGLIKNSLFHHVGYGGGGDAIDVSGSKIHVTETRITDIQDKALSVGEGSILQATNVSISNVSIGAASKDGSRLVISDSQFNHITFTALMAYIKKPEYGPATISATGLTMKETSTTAIAQTGNIIEIDGRQTPTQSINIETLYATTMKHGKRR